MTGLHTVKNNDLKKVSGEGSLENNIKQLITDEAYSQISAKFPKLVPIILGINIVETIDDSTTIGAAVLGVEGKKLLIPVVYSDGKVDATTFIYSEDEDTILALTKKVVSIVITSSPVLSGGVPDNNKPQNYDIGDIHKLFVPPKTFSPKTASTGGILFAVLEQSDLLKTALAKKLENKDYREAFVESYGEEATLHVESTSLEKVASIEDNTPSEVIYSMKDVMRSDWLEKKAAAAEFASNGFVISQGADIPKYSLEKVASIETRLKSITGETSLSTIDLNHAGVYSVFALQDLKPCDLIISKNINSSKHTPPFVIYGPSSMNKEGTIDGNGTIGTQKNISDVSIFRDFSTLNDSIEKRVHLVFIKNGEIFGHVTPFISADSISSGLGTTTITLSPGSAVESIVIDKNSSAYPSVLGTTVYVGDKNIKLVENNTDRKAVIKVSDLAREEAGGRLIKVAYDGVEFFYKQASYSKSALVNELLSDGFDKNSIYGIVKTAAATGSSELSAVNAKLDQLGSIVMNLAGQIQQMTQAAESAGAGLTQAQQPQQPQAEQQPEQQEAPAQEQQQTPQLGMEDPNSGMPTQQQEAEAQQAQQAQVQQDQQMLQQQPQGGEQQPDVEGMNQSIDPSVLKTLSELKDSNVMDVGIISMIGANSDIGAVVSQYKGDVHSGASAIGRIFLNTLVKKNTIVEQIGEPKYKQLTNNLRAVFVKISDLYVDITRLQLESDGKMAS